MAVVKFWFRSEIEAVSRRRCLGLRRSCRVLVSAALLTLTVAVFGEDTLSDQSTAANSNVVNGAVISASERANANVSNHHDVAVSKPNYAAEQAIWASYYLFVVAACPSQWCNWSLLGSIQLILLFQQSGPFTERISSSKYPKYKEYQKRVPLYIPSIKTFSSLFVATNETDRDGNQGGDSNSDKKQS